MSSGTGTARPQSLFERITDLYDRNLFMQAYQETRDYWNGKAKLDDFTVDELVLGMRLASRLGGSRISRWIGREAIKRAPSHPKVRYFATNLCSFGSRYFDRFREMEAKPELEGADSDTQASWLSYSAVLWASVRDFEKAHSCLAAARQWETKDGWLLSCESDVLAYEDRWKEALEAAAKGWEQSPGTPYCARSLASSLLNLGHVEEAAEMLEKAAAAGESYDIALTACWYLCALAETRTGEGRMQVLVRASAMVDRATALAPLADRDTRALIARNRLDIAELADDHVAMEHWAKEARSPFHRKVLENLRKDPQGERLRLPFPRTIQKHNECLPTAIGSAMAAMGTPIDADAMAAELTFGGTAEWAAAEWLEKQGFVVRFFTATGELTRTLIKKGFAFELTLEFDTSAHAVAVVGLDEAAGTALVHDPGGFRSTEYLLESLGRNEAPLGPRAMVVVRPERAQLLDELLPKADVETMTAREAHRRKEFLHGAASARDVVAEIAARHPLHPNSRLLQALQDHNDGREGSALGQFQKLLDEFPGSAYVRRNLLACCRSVRNTALMRKTLQDVVERGSLPGVQSQQTWVNAPADYVSEYADLLRLSGETSARAKRMLKKLLGRASYCASAWHDLGDLLWTERDVDTALLGYRIASCLADKHEHYARSYSDALGRVGREEEGFAWLERRTRRFGKSLEGVGTWASLILALEDAGHPKRALEVAEEALEAQGDSAEMLALLAPFQARMGRWTEAEALLKRLGQTGNLEMFDQACARYYGMRGELSRALEHAEKWLSRSPMSMRAREEVVKLIARRDGPKASIKRAREWVVERPGHEEMEDLYCRQLDRLSYTSWPKYRLLLRRVKRNREDSWVWRELVFCAMYDFETPEGPRQRRMQARIERFLGECDRTSPGETVTLRAHAQWLETRGEWTEAVSHWLEAVEREPGNAYGYRHLWDCAARLNKEERLAVWTKMQSALLREPGHSSVAREIIMLAATRFGVTAAEEAVAGWMKSRPEDPEVVEAFVDVLLTHGHGRTDYERALQMLLPELERFPFHLGLRLSHADALQKLGEFQKAEEVFQEIVRRHPDNLWSRIRLAWMKQRRGETEKALQELQAAGPLDPQSNSVDRARVEMLMEEQRFAEAREAIRRTSARIPRDVNWRENAIRLLIACGDTEHAIETAYEGVREYPRGAYLWLLLGKTLYKHREYAAQGEIESCLRRSLSLNDQLYEAADHLVMLLAEQRRYPEAEEVLRRLEKRMTDPAPALGRIAWIRRRKGEKREALQDMMQLLQQDPSYDWGWDLLLEWFNEDKLWDDARRVLAEVIPEQRTNTRLRHRRLETLAAAGEKADVLDREWKSLLHDFPEDESLHVIRYDELRKEERTPQAALVLEHIRAVHPDSPYVLARYVEVLVSEKNKEEAIRNLMRLLFAEAEPSTWPPEYAWSAIKAGQYEKDAYQKACELLRQGQQPTSRAVSIVATHAIESGQAEKRRRQPYLRTWFPDRGAKEILKLLRLIDASSAARAAHRAKLLSKLSDYGYERLVVRYWKKHRGQVEGNLATWSELARALTGLKMYRTARKVMAGWRERKGVAMWVVANYVMCLKGTGKRQLKQLRSTCHDALAGLSHDHCARYLVYCEAEACALLKDREGLLECWHRNRAYFDGKLEKGEWFEDTRRYLLADIPVAARNLESGEIRRYRANVRGLRSERFKASLPTLPETGQVNGRLLWWLIWVGVIILMNVITQLSKN